MMYAAVNIDDMHGSPPDEEVYEEPPPNLEVIYQAFGEQADLYKDVLQVKSTATAEQIQMAYFDRRSELFALLASIDSEEEQDDITASHRFHAERKMDAVVMAVRILGDPQLRQEYDNVVTLQLRTRKHPKEPPSSSGASRASSTREPDGVYAGVGIFDDDDEAVAVAPPSPRAPRSPKRRSPKRRSPRHVSPPADHEIPDDFKRSSSSADEVMGRNHDHHHYEQQLLLQEPDYEFVRSSSSNKDKHHKGKGKKHHLKSNKHNHHNQRQLPEEVVDAFVATPPGLDDNETFPDTALQDEATLDDTKTWDDQATLASNSTAGDWTRDSRRLTKGGTSTLSNITNAGFVSRIQEEVAGTVEDTLVSFEQVLNVFTLQERDIQAVMGRIDKAKRQLRKRR